MEVVQHLHIQILKLLQLMRSIQNFSRVASNRLVLTFCSHLDKHWGCHMQHSAHVSLCADSATTGHVPRLVIPPARLSWPHPLSDQGQGLGKTPVPSPPLLQGRCAQRSPSSQHTIDYFVMLFIWNDLSPFFLLLS